MRKKKRDEERIKLMIKEEKRKGVIFKNKFDDIINKFGTKNSDHKKIIGDNIVIIIPNDRGKEVIEEGKDQK